MTRVHLATASLALLILTLVPVSQADDFESTFFPDVPVGLTMTGGSAAITTADAHSGTQSLKITNAGTGYGARWYVGGDQCEMEVWLKLEIAPGGGSNVVISLLSEGLDDKAATSVQGTGSSELVNTGASPASGTGAAVAGLTETVWKRFGIRSCYSGQGIFFYDDGVGGQNSVTVTYANWASRSDLVYVQISGNALAPNLYVDDTSWTGILGPFTDPGTVFCADVTDDANDWGYEYSEGVTESDGVFTFQSDDDNFDYLGKGMNPGSQALQTTFRVKADSDGRTAVFRSTFSFVSGTPDATTKGNGGQAGETGTQQFANLVEVRITEVGDDWYLNFPTIQSGTRTLLTLTAEATGSTGTSLGINSEANSYRTFVFQLDTRPTADHGLALYHQGVLTATADIPAVFADDVIENVWFVSEGASGSFDAEIKMQGPGQDVGGSSSCIFDLSGGAAAEGSAGAANLDTDRGLGNETAEVDDPSCGFVGLCTTDTAPTGFTVSSFNFLLGIIFLASLAGGFFLFTKSAMMAGIGSLVGFLGGYAFGLFPLWAVLLVVLIAATGAVLYFRGGTSGGG